MIAFSGLDVLLQRPVDDLQLVQALSAALGLSPSRIAEIRDLQDYPERDACDVVAVVSAVAGEAEALVQLHAGAIALRFESELDVVRELARLLAVNCLTPHEGDNPYLMWRVTPDGVTDLIALRVPAADHSRFEVERVIGTDAETSC